ncbi:MAG: DEAD/DEAH box helicase [Deltaproteobacteria bacterium]|jgi:superfamily II RNA helicase|nr:DEAD/DEAH box helicase [Deltaproteobacteria bacterium]
MPKNPPRSRSRLPGRSKGREASRPSEKAREKKNSAPALPGTAPAVNVSREARIFLDQIGQPPDGPLVPDPFQTEAVRLIQHQDVIVSAPTGSGKTWIAQEALAAELARGGRAWYASPLKALSNAKYLEFGRVFGEAQVGLLTGDLRLNTQAPIIVGTTEILRNQLYDSMAGSGSSPGQAVCDLVVLDEAHYLGDPERGVVWEEVLIYLPARVRLLLLSATIDNAGDLASWLTSIRSQKTQVVMGGERPVPLVSLCWQKNELLTLEKAVRSPASGSSSRSQSPDPSLMLPILENLSLTPAIFFLATRRQCDLAARSTGVRRKEDPERRRRRLEVIDEYLEGYPILKGHKHLAILRNSAAAAHHAGHLPIYKMLVEELMSQGLLSAIYATSTVSAGVNFPARTVVISQSDRFNGVFYNPLTATELAQMTGRAGRRGRDNIGFAVLLPGSYMRLKYMGTLFRSAPEPVLSRLEINFSMVLNLIQALDPKSIMDLFSRSLAAWQASSRKDSRSLDQAAAKIWYEFMRYFIFLQKQGLISPRSRLTEPGELAARLRLDHPLVFYQAIARRALPSGDPALLAGVCASFLQEKPSESAFKPPKVLQAALHQVWEAVRPMIRDLQESNFSWPAVDTASAWTLWAWAREESFSRVVQLLGHDEGDAVRLILRAAEHLNQLTDLPGQPELAQAAVLARKKILRDPVI